MYLETISSSSITVDIINHTHKKRYKKETIYGFHEAKKDHSIMVVKTLFGDIINISPFWMATEESVA